MAAISPCGANAQERPPQAATLLRGRVIGPDSAIIRGADITINVGGIADSFQARTDQSGQFSVALARLPDRVIVSVLAVGFARYQQEHVVTARGNESAMLVIGMRPAVRTLPVISTIAQRARVQRADQQSAEGGPGVSSRLHGIVDLSNPVFADPGGDIGNALINLPNVAVPISGGTGVEGISVFGVGGESNTSTLNGLSFGGASLPANGFSLQAVTASYDPSRGGFGGLNASVRFPSGQPNVRRGVHGTLEPSSLQPQQSGTYLSSRPTRMTVNAYAAGSATPRGSILYNSTLQVSRSEATRFGLGGADPASLARVGADADAVRRIVNIASAYGLPIARGVIGTSSTTASYFGRLDIRPSPGEQSARGSGETGFSATDDQWALLAGVTRSQHLTGGAGTSVLSNTSDFGLTNLLFSTTLSRYLRGWVLNETSVGLSGARSHSAPGLLIPSAVVRLSDPGSTSTTSIDVGGRGVTVQTSRSFRAQFRNESAWHTADRRHLFRIALDAQFERSNVDDGRSLGTFTYYSAADYVANQPGRFSRSLQKSSVPVEAMNLAAGIGDIYTPYLGQATRQQLQLQYGIRAELNEVRPAPARNTLLHSSLGVDNAHIPRLAAVLPMVGFTQAIGRMTQPGNPRPVSRGAVMGGVRAYRPMASPGLIDPLVRSNGLASGTEQVICEKGDISSPNWSALLQGGAVAENCQGLGSLTFNGSAPDVRTLGHGFRLAESIRPALGMSGVIAGSLTGAVNVTFAHNRGRLDVLDRNLSANPAFSLADESMRPVYSPLSAIDASTGVVAVGAARRSQQFGNVLESRSDMTQQVWNVMGFLSRTFGRPSVGRTYATGMIAYSWTAGREGNRGFSASTAGDPRVTEDASLSLPRHTLSMNGSLHVPRWGFMSGWLRTASPYRYTPRVNGDVNGDGYFNDRAFVFAPNSANDPALDSQMRQLLELAPGRAVECLERQQGGVASRNSCRGPSSATLNFSFTPDPYRLRLGNRGSLTIVATNVLAGVDQLLHGSTGLRGWGASGSPDPTLLRIMGFDPVARRYRYSVNPAFGSTDASRAFGGSPFRITINVRLDLKPDWESTAITTFLNSAKVLPSEELSVEQIRALLRRAANAQDNFASLVRMRDSLRLTQLQVDSIQSIGATFKLARDAAYDSLAVALAVRQKYDDDEGRRAWHEVLARTNREKALAWARVRRLLSPAQYAMVPEFWKANDGLSTTVIDHYGRKPQIYPP